MAGRVAVVTGVSRRDGIGFAVARRLAGDGADVFVQGWAAHDAEQPWGEDPLGVEGVTEALRQQVGQRGGRILHMEADFEHPLSPRAVVEAAAAELGHVDILVANHARSSKQQLGGMTAAEVDTTLAVNVRATLLLVQAYVSLHDGRPGGRVVLFTSGQHLEPGPDELPYMASKGALHQITASLAAAVVDRGITVNCINPGPTDTGWAEPDQADEVRRRHPQGRWGTPDDAARIIGWLVSDDGQWITGQVINSDGGWCLT